MHPIIYRTLSVSVPTPVAMPKFKQVDVFTRTKYKGNPLAVFFDADDLSKEDMTNMSHWTNLSESTFLVKPTDPSADYKVHIYGLEGELPFAGHPTVGTCFALLEAGLIKPKNGKVIQECGAGLVEINILGPTDAPLIEFTLPYAKRSEVSDKDSQEIAAALGTKVEACAIYEVGPVWLTVKVSDAKTLISIEPDFNKIERLLARLNVTGLQVIGTHEGNSKYEVRTFAPYVEVKEDPVCGSGGGATAVFLRDTYGVRGTVQLLQGRRVRRAGQLTVNGEKQSVAGHAVTVIDGEW